MSRLRQERDLGTISILMVTNATGVDNIALEEYAKWQEKKYKEILH